MTVTFYSFLMCSRLIDNVAVESHLSYFFHDTFLSVYLYMYGYKYI